jgi:hypothetical protein
LHAAASPGNTQGVGSGDRLTSTQWTAYVTSMRSPNQFFGTAQLGRSEAVRLRDQIQSKYEELSMKHGARTIDQVPDARRLDYLFSAARR